MKRLISLILISVALLSFVGCEKGEEMEFDLFESTVSRVSPASGGQFYEDALNAEKLEDRKNKTLPVYRIDTKEELEGFKTTYDNQIYISQGNEDKTAFCDKVEKYDDSFFGENSLLIVYVISGSGSYEYAFDSISITKDSVCVHIAITNDPKFGTCDMAGWLITVAVPDSLLKGCTSFDAVNDGYKGDVTTSSKPESDESKKPSSEYNFTARLLEKTADGSYLMKVTDVGNGNFAIGNEVVVISDMLSHFNIGDTLNVQFDGKVTMSIPPQVVNVLGVTFINGAE